MELRFVIIFEVLICFSSQQLEFGKVRFIPNQVVRIISIRHSLFNKLFA